MARPVIDEAMPHYSSSSMIPRSSLVLSYPLTGYNSDYGVHWNPINPVQVKPLPWGL
jgi:hypothetical protein